MDKGFEINIFLEVDEIGKVKSFNIPTENHFNRNLAQAFTKLKSNINEFIHCKKCSTILQIFLYSPIVEGQIGESNSNILIKKDDVFIKSETPNEQLENYLWSANDEEKLLSNKGESFFYSCESYDKSKRVQSILFCNICHKKFKNKSGLSSHKRNCMPKECSNDNKMLTCIKCEKNMPVFEINLDKTSEVEEKICKDCTEHKKIDSDQFKCYLCFKIFDKKRSYNQHIRNHTNPTPYTCDICYAVFAQKKSIREHINKKHNHSYEWKYCKTCSPEKMFFHSQNYKKHMKFVHNTIVEVTEKEDEHRCDGCDEKFKNLLSMSTHRRFCNPAMPRTAAPTCHHCGKVYSKWYTVKEHIRIVHNGEFIFQCELCGKPVKSKKQLRYHMDKFHAPQQIFACTQCHKTFKSKEGLTAHIHVKHLNTAEFTCQICTKKFYKKHSLDAHINIVHAVDRPFACDKCPKTFKVQSQLQSHQYSMHVPDEFKRKYPCNQCELVTTSEALLKKHQIVHLPDSEKPFHCKFCLKGFGTEHDLNRHEKSHTNERPFACKVCGKGFVTYVELKQHFIAQHTGDKPFICEICQQGHKDRWSYRNHLSAHERELGITLDKSIKKFMDKYKDLKL